MKPLTLDECEVTVRCEPEDIDPAEEFDSGDPEQDAQIVADIRHKLECGYDWAWCCAVVTVSYRGIYSVQTLGGCSYDGEREFREGGYFQSMCREALAELNAKLTGLQR